MLLEHVLRLECFFLLLLRNNNFFVTSHCKSNAVVFCFVVHSGEMHNHLTTSIPTHFPSSVPFLLHDLPVNLPFDLSTHLILSDN